MAKKKSKGKRPPPSLAGHPGVPKRKGRTVYVIEDFNHDSGTGGVSGVLSDEAAAKKLSKRFRDSGAEREVWYSKHIIDDPDSPGIETLEEELSEYAEENPRRATAQQELKRKLMR